MSFFAVPYEIHFDDTMAYGSHHFLTNFKFQCAGREHMLFSDAMYRDAAFREDFDKVILYTAEAYSRNLGPAQLGDRLTVLTTVEERTSIGLRFCFRTVREDGEPVAAGYQSVLCASRATGQIVAFPKSFEVCFDRFSEVNEANAETSFRDAVQRGGAGVKRLFPESVRALVRTAWAAGRPAAGIVRAAPLTFPPVTHVLVCGGQGTFDADVLAGLVAAVPEARAELAAVVERTQQRLGLDLRPLLVGGNAARAAVAAAPDLDQLGIFLTGVLAGRIASGDLVIGHSFGEIAALTVAGVLTVIDGAEAVCQRVLALRGCEGLGTLAAVGLSEPGVRDLLRDTPELTFAGVNHAGQCVVAGPAAALDALTTLVAGQGRPVTRVASRYPFHSEALRPAAVRYEAALTGLPTSAPKIPVYSPIDGRLYTGAPGEVAAALARHLIRPFDFAGAVARAVVAGAHTFFDASGGRMGRLVRKLVPESVAVREVVGDARAVEPGAEHTIAIVSLGCLFPGGATDPEAYWRLVRDGGCGVREDATLDADFVARPLTADKALTTLAGRVDDAWLEGDGVRIQRLLRPALRQALNGLRVPSADRVRVLLGSTADGSDALDDTLAIEALDLDAASTATLAAAMGVRPGSSSDIAPHKALSAVIHERLAGVPVTLVDAACASSLYTVALGATLLRSGEADLVLAGGAFAPGPGNNCLFSQFKGLSTRAIRPFDAEADGVIFGEGAGLVALKRLSDAVRDGDRVWGVLAGIGLSSDGRSSSANVPRAEGQLLAIERAWEGLDPATVDYIEAHGTATPAGDGTELDALHRFFGDRVQRRLPIGSVKAQTGHLGWVAGVASLLKLCKMMEHDLIPRQHAFETTGTALRKVEGRFEVLASARPWPRGAQPRRAATSGFGFGGTNAHLVLQESGAAPLKPADDGLVVVATALRLPDGARFGEINLPAGVRVLPDLADELDPTQRLAVAGAADVLAQLGQPDLRATTALVLGLEGKSARGVEAIGRVLGDRVRRLLAGLGPEAVSRASAAIDRLRPSNAYTLQAMMPNVTPGRAANLLDLQGPNMVVDAGRATLAEAMATAPGLLALGAELVIAGGVHASAHVPRGDGRLAAGDGMVLVALTTPAIAARRGLTVLARLERAAAGSASAPVGLDRRAVEGGVALTEAIADAGRGIATTVTLPGDRAGWAVSPADGVRPGRDPLEVAASRAAANGHRVSVAPPAVGATAASASSAPASIAPSPADPAPRQGTPNPGFSTAVPVRYATPVLLDRPATTAPITWRDRRVVVLSDGPVGERVAHALRAQGADARLVLTTTTTAAEDVVLPVDDADLLLAVRHLVPGDLDALVTQATTDRALADLTFLAARRAYPRLTAGKTSLVALHLGGLGESGLHPVTGQLAGMLKSIAREAPGQVRVTSTSHDDVGLALDQVARELGGAVEVETAFDGTTRQVRVLQELVHTPGPSPLSERSVVVATGGARGVTAVLVEALLRRHACTVVLLGRTAEGEAPAHVLAASEDELDAMEQVFYAEQVAADPTARIGELRRRFERYRSAHELHHNLVRLRACPGEVVYRKADVTSAADVDAALDEVRARYGRLDLIVHGAGLQTSKKLDRRKLDELRRNMDVKLLGLHRLHMAATARFGAVPVHALTSAFSYFGNDGQADYGAANETLDRMCAHAPGWTSIGWLAWDRVGMTRSPEYAVLGAARNLRGVSAEEGAELFLRVVDAPAPAAIHHQLTDGEVAWYGLELLPPTSLRPVTFDQSRLSCLADHLVRGTPTVPGAWALDRMVPPELRDADAIAVEDIAFSRFVRVPTGGRQDLRMASSSVAAGTAVRLMGDIVHKSGAVLQPDVEFSTATFHRSERPTARLAVSVDGPVTDDPYCRPDSPITLRNGFDCLRDVRVGASGRTARFESRGSHGAHTVPALLLDAAWRLSAMHAQPDTVYAPVRFRRVTFSHDALSASAGSITLVATPPRVEGEDVHCDRVEAITPDGRVLLSVEGGLARRIP